MPVPQDGDDAAALKAAFKHISNWTATDGEPIELEAVEQVLHLAQAQHIGASADAKPWMEMIIKMLMKVVDG
jgi:hypothetical protein